MRADNGDAGKVNAFVAFPFDGIRSSRYEYVNPPLAGAESSPCQEGGGDEEAITTQAAADSSVRLPRSYISRVKNQYGYR